MNAVFVILVMCWLGDLRMSPHMWCVLFLCLCSCSKEMVVDRTRPARYVWALFLHIIECWEVWTFTSTLKFVWLWEIETFCEINASVSFHKFVKSIKYTMWCLRLQLTVNERTFTHQHAFLRWHSYRMEKGQNIVRSLKRHSDGTFTSDFTHYLDKIKAKDFVEWLASTKQEGWAEKPHFCQSCFTGGDVIWLSSNISTFPGTAGLLNTLVSFWIKVKTVHVSSLI